jgi:hypothetical protein
MNPENNFQTWGEAFTSSMQDLWFKLADFLPQLLGAIIILIIGLIIASFLGKLAKKVLVFARVDSALDNVGATEDLNKIGVKTSLSSIIAWLVKWFFILVTLIAVIDVLGIEQLTQFLNDIILYIPKVLAAVFILAIGLAAGRFLHNVVSKTVLASRLPDTSAPILANIAKWSIIIFSLMAALVQLGIAAGMIQILFAGLIIAFALAIGLSFGLGGHEAVKRWLDRTVK